MLKLPEEKKVVLSVTVEPNLLESLRKYKKISGVSASWVVRNLLTTYLKAVVKYNEE